MDMDIFFHICIQNTNLAWIEIIQAWEDPLQLQTHVDALKQWITKI